MIGFLRKAPKDSIHCAAVRACCVEGRIRRPQEEKEEATGERDKGQGLKEREGHTGSVHR